MRICRQARISQKWPVVAANPMLIWRRRSGTLQRFASHEADCMRNIETVEVETGPEPVGSVIWLHGLGADGHDFEPIVPELRLPETMPLRFVFPHAPVRPVTVNGGMAMRAWYDIVSLDKEGRADESGVRESSEILDDLIARELERGIEASKIVIAGFSQGGAIVLHNMLRRSEQLAGVMALSTYVPLPNATDVEIDEHRDAASLPVFVGHGSVDPMVPVQAGKNSAALLDSLGYRVQWHEYPMAHGVCPQEIDDIRDWLVSIYAP